MPLASVGGFAAAAFFVLSRYASVITRLPKPIEFRVYDGIMTMVLPYTFIDSYSMLDCLNAYATWLFLDTLDASWNCFATSTSDSP